MGCPAKKVLQTACGSALMKDEALVARILEAVCAAVSVPVTLKIRTGWDREHRNALAIAGIAEQTGVAMLTIHGRTREDGFRGEAEYETIRTVKAAVSIPVIANGDIDSGEKARRVMALTGADGVMIGRASYAIRGSSRRSAPPSAIFPKGRRRGLRNDMRSFATTCAVILTIMAVLEVP